MSSIIRDLKATGKKISEGEQVLNVIRVFLKESQHWSYVKTVLMHFEHIKIFVEVQSHIEMEEECLKMLGTSHVAFVAKGNRPKGNKNNRGRQAKTGHRRTQNGKPKARIAKKQKAKGNGGINIAHVKFYNCGKKGHYARDCPEPKKVLSSTCSLELYVCSHVLVANFLPNWIVDMEASKHIV